MTGDPGNEDSRRYTPGGEPLSVFIVDDHDVVLEGLVAILGREPDLEIVGTAPSAEAALSDLIRLDPHVVVLDQRLPGMTGVELCREIAERRLRTQVIMLSAFIDEESAEAAICAGARAYVVKDVDASELIRAIRAGAAGLMSIDAKVVGNIWRWAARLDAPADPLRPAQVEILRLLSAGKTISQIAQGLGVTRETAKSYTREIYRRLGVHSRSEATALAIRRGLV